MRCFFCQLISWRCFVCSCVCFWGMFFSRCLDIFSLWCWWLCVQYVNWLGEWTRTWASHPPFLPKGDWNNNFTLALWYSPLGGRGVFLCKKCLFINCTSLLLGALVITVWWLILGLYVFCTVGAFHVSWLIRWHHVHIFLSLLGDIIMVPLFSSLEHLSFAHFSCSG